MASPLQNSMNSLQTYFSKRPADLLRPSKSSLDDVKAIMQKILDDNSLKEFFRLDLHEGDEYGESPLPFNDVTYEEGIKPSLIKKVVSVISNAAVPAEA